MKVIRAVDYNDMCRKAANFMSAQVILKPNSVLGLATGSTPIGIYKQLVTWYVEGDLDFSNTVSVNLDEYLGLEPDNPQSYRWYMENHFFRHINICRENVHLPNGLETDREKECARYESIISRHGGIDMQLLGLGHNGHIGFNEPGSEFEPLTHCVRLTDSTVQANKRFFENEDEVPRFAYTMGMRAIMQADCILVVVSGQDKAQIVKEAFHGPITPQVPASALQLHKNAIIIGSEDALAMLQ